MRSAFCFAISSSSCLGVWASLKTPSSKATASSLRQGKFITNAEMTQSFEWTSTTRSAKEAMEITFPKSAGWANGCFWEGGCRDGKVMTQEVVGDWVEKDLLGGPDPFEDHGGLVPLPWPAQRDTGDQLGDGQYVGYSRRQVCFIVAKALLGADTMLYANGLSRILNTTVGHCGFPAPSVKRPDDTRPSALTGEFGISLWNLLSACAADPTLKDGQHGPLILVAKGKARDEVETVRAAASHAKLSKAHLSACRYNDGDAGPVQGEGFAKMPADVCTPPTTGAPGRDFMSGGVTRVKGQAIQDISAKFLGGYVFGNACGLGGGQDERLMTYFPEVFALTFFLSQDADHPQLREPSWILGARMLHVGLDGTTRFDHRMELDNGAPLNSDLVEVKVGSDTYSISSTTPFLGFMSENQDFLGESAVWDGQRSVSDMRKHMILARQNRHPLQRSVDPADWYAFMFQVRAWYSAVALTSYNVDVRPALRALVKSLGTGPFLSGLWFGDSQLGFLTVWVGHAAAASTWAAPRTHGDVDQEGEPAADARSPPLPVQYYVYADFTENPGNQCFVHSKAACEKCLQTCAANPLPRSSFWLPDWAFMGPGNNMSCVVDSEKYCGKKGFQDVVAAYSQKTAIRLWEDVEKILRAGPQTESQIFDLLLAE